MHSWLPCCARVTMASTPSCFMQPGCARERHCRHSSGDMLLSDAFLTYADALARGAVPVERRRDNQALAPEPIDVAAVLDSATNSDDPASVIEALAPTTPTYVALRQALKKHRSGTPGSSRTSTERLQTIEVNLERQRWLPRPLPASRAWVNVADEQLVLYRAGPAGLLDARRCRRRRRPQSKSGVSRDNRRQLLQPAMGHPGRHRRGGDFAEA